MMFSTEILFNKVEQEYMALLDGTWLTHASLSRDIISEYIKLTKPRMELAWSLVTCLKLLFVVII